mgnify:CR=1 FL=1
MRNEQVGRAGLLLDILHQVDHLRLNGHVQRRDALICDDELGVHDEGAGNAHALALAARELVGIAVGVLVGLVGLYSMRALRRGGIAFVKHIFKHMGSPLLL